ncbi:MAG: flagellar assembly protein FliH [Bosea sp. (in: a-proteobacteria)]
MAAATKFMFGTDFREGGRRAADEADVAAARAQGFRDGEAQGRQQGEAQLLALAGQIAQTADRLLAREDERAETVEAQAVQVALATARALAGAALAERPLAEVEAAVRECMVHARLAAHLVVRVNEAAVEQVEGLLKRLAQQSGYAGRLIVLGEPDIMQGDGRIEWADGGFAIDRQRLSQQVEQAVARVFGRSLAAMDTGDAAR